MARPKPSTFDKVKTVAENRRARFEYFIEDTFEAGIALSGTEVKSLRFGEGSIAHSRTTSAKRPRTPTASATSRG